VKYEIKIYFFETFGTSNVQRLRDQGSGIRDQPSGLKQTEFSGMLRNL